MWTEAFKLPLAHQVIRTLNDNEVTCEFTEDIAGFIWQRAGAVGRFIPEGLLKAVPGEFQPRFGEGCVWCRDSYALSSEHGQGILSQMESRIVSQRKPGEGMRPQVIQRTGREMYLSGNGMLEFQCMGRIPEPGFVRLGEVGQHKHVVKVGYARDGIPIEDAAMEIACDQPRAKVIQAHRSYAVQQGAEFFLHAFVLL